MTYMVVYLACLKDDCRFLRSHNKILFDGFCGIFKDNKENVVLNVNFMAFSHTVPVKVPPHCEDLFEM